MAEYKRWKVFDKLFSRKRPTAHIDPLVEAFLTGGDTPHHEPLKLELTATRSLDEIKAEVRAHLEENTKRLSEMKTTVQHDYFNMTEEESKERRRKLRADMAELNKDGPRKIKLSKQRRDEMIADGTLDKKWLK